MANQTHTERGGSGNFTNDRDKASEAGRKGGQHSHSGSQGDSTSEENSTERGANSNPANDRERGSDAGRSGGDPSQRNHQR